MKNINYLRWDVPFIRNVLLPDGMYHPGENRGYFKETDRTTGRDKKAETQDINDVHLRDKDSLYENDDETSVVTMYLTVSRGNSSEERLIPGRRSTVIRPMIMTRWE